MPAPGFRAGRAGMATLPANPETVGWKGNS